MPDNPAEPTGQQNTGAATDQNSTSTTDTGVDTTTGVEPDEDTDTGLDPKVKDKIERSNRESAALRKRVKELEGLAAKLKTLEDKDKTESQRLADQVAELQTQLAEHKVREVRAQAAAAVGLPAAMAQFITAADADEAKAQAKQLLEWGRTAGGVTDFRQGARTPAPQKMTGDDFIRRMAGRQ